MKTIGTRTFIAAGVYFILIFTAPLIYAEDVLPSWNDGKNKQSLVYFVKRVTTPGPDLVPEAVCIAVFDNDGTLWAEQPMYFQFFFALDCVKALAPQHPEWVTRNRSPRCSKGISRALWQMAKKQSSKSLWSPTRV